MSSEESRDRQLDGQENADEQVLDLLPGYALGVLEREERLAVESGLASSAALRAEYERYLRTVESLNEATPLSTPPDTLQARIMSSLSTEQVAMPVPLRTRTSTRLLASAAAVLVLVLGGAVALLIGEVRERDDRIASLEEPSEARGSTDFTQPLVWSTIGSDSGAAQPKGYFCRTEDGSVGWIIIEGMPAGDDNVLQLWLVDGERVVNGGMFATDEAGRGFGVVRVNVPVHTFSQIWITIEPPGGSPGPTSDPDVRAPIV